MENQEVDPAANAEQDLKIDANEQEDDIFHKLGVELPVGVFNEMPSLSFDTRHWIAGALADIPDISRYQLKFLETLNSEETLEALRTLRHDLSNWHFSEWDEGHKYDSIIDLILSLKTSSFTWEEKTRHMLQEVKVSLEGIFQLVNVISQGDTHRSKDSHIFTTLEVLRNQINFYNDLSLDSAYFTSFYRGYHGKSSLSQYHDLRKENQELKNERKQLQAEIKAYKKV